MKRITSLLLALTLAASLSACGNGKADMYCSTCGNGLSKSDVFCNECGTQLSGTVKDEKPEVNKQTEKTTTTTSVSTTTQKSSTTKGKTTTKAKPTTTKAKVSKTTQKAHTHSYTKKATPATCTEKGYTTYTCSCGHAYKDNYVNAAHKYKDYVCTACGAVDKSHAYEYLVMWAKKNGEVDGTTVDYIIQDGNYFFKLSYSAQYDILNISVFGYSGANFSHCILSLDTFFYGVSFVECDLTGYLDASEFTPSSPIAYDKYEGENSKNEYIEYSRKKLVSLLDWFIAFLEEENLGITVADLGFTAFQ